MNFFQPHLFKKIFFTLVAILFVSNTFAFQGTGRIVGKVVDEKGESIIGATVKVVGVTGGASTNIDGAFNISLAAGTYSLDITYISYQPKRITGIVVKTGEVSTLNISLSPSSSQLNEVVIVSTYSKSNTEGLFVKQKNAVNFTNGISAEQITKTPDANVGQSLKRISGISTFDNKYVVVRGISERYNVATLDGTPMPSTDYSRRNFSFELIPSEMIESVLVHKTVTPDLPVGFGGGMIQVNSKDIPTQNFLTLSIGSGYNSQSTGNDFLSNKRGKYDYLGFDDGTRKMATQPLVSTSGKQSSSTNPFTTADFEQSKSFTNNWGVYNYVAAPGQNLALSFGRAIELKKPENRFGYIAALNYRNSQNIARIENRRDRFMLSQPNIDLFKNGPIGGGKIYSFNSTLGAMLNIGFKSKTNTFSLKNTYSRVFSNVTTNIFGYDEATSDLYVGPQYSPAVQRFSVEPDFLSLLQTKLMGEHQVGTYKFAWDLSRTSVDRQRKDMMRRELINRDQLYGNFYTDWFKDAGYT
ncbi:MAG: TonB-dependent receptor, partial [Sphingobacteriaceae bacterium]|nr:TonB-dependent receptor [Sphingobacteriaceae bacterium]